MRAAAAILTLLLTTSALAADPAEEVRQTEIAFAKAFADRDQARFFSFVAEDAVFLGSNAMQSGKGQVVKKWSRFFDDARAPFSWKPDRVVTNAAGTLGLSTGPVLNPEGKQIGNYSSVWQRQSGGDWKIVFDGPGSPACPQAAQ